MGAVETLMIQNVVGILGNLLNSLKLLEIFDTLKIPKNHVGNISSIRDFKHVVETLMTQNVVGVQKKLRLYCKILFIFKHNIVSKMLFL